MSLGERLDRLEPRERQLLTVLLGVFVGFVVLLVPLGVSAMLGGKRDENQELRDAIQAIHSGRDQVRKQREERDAVVARYADKAPPLAGYLAKLAKDNGFDIPESQDRAEVPHGKRYNERSTKLVLKKVPLLNLTKFMEGIAQSKHPLSITRLNIRKRGTEPDSYDVEMVVSTYDRTEKKSKPAESGEGEGGGE